MRTTSENLKGLSGVYCAIHRDSGMCYVGSSVNIHARIVGHLSDAKIRNRTRFHQALNEFGSDAFDLEVLERCPRKELFEREKFYIVLLNAASTNGLNINRSPGGVFKGARDPLWNARISAGMMGRIVSEETRKKISVAQKGKVLPEEHKRRIRASKLGCTHSLEARAKMGAAKLGKPLSDSHKKKMSAARLGVPLSMNHLENIRKARRKLKGTKLSPERRAKMVKVWVKRKLNTK